MLLGLLWPSFLVASSAEPTFDADPPKNVATPAANAVNTVTEEATPGIDNAVQMAQEEVRDPFANSAPPEGEAPVGPVAPAGPAITVELQGMGFGSKDAYAVIGGNVYYKGDEKNGIKLLEVRRREVDVLVNGGKVTVPLFPDQDLKNAKDRAEKKSANTDNKEAPVV